MHHWSVNMYLKCQPYCVVCFHDFYECKYNVLNSNIILDLKYENIF